MKIGLNIEETPRKNNKENSKEILNILFTRKHKKSVIGVTGAASNSETKKLKHLLTQFR